MMISGVPAGTVTAARPRPDPVTVAGKIIAAIVAILGTGMFALPTGILGAGFVEEMQKSRRSVKTCPCCGRELTE